MERDFPIEWLPSDMLDPLGLILECEGQDIDEGRSRGASIDDYYSAMRASR